LLDQSLEIVGIGKKVAPRSGEWLNTGMVEAGYGPVTK
jgi:hypothetical protein